MDKSAPTIAISIKIEIFAVEKLLRVSIFPALISAEIPSTADQGSSKTEIAKTLTFSVLQL